MATGADTRASNSRRVRRTREDAERQLLDAAEQFLAEHEFRELTVEALTRRVGMGRSAFYNYFPDRNAVLEVLLEGVIDEFLEAIRPWLEGQEGPEASPVAVLEAGALVYASHARLMAAVHEASFHDAAIKAFYMERVDTVAEHALKAVRRDVRAGRSTVSSPRELVYSLVWMNTSLLAERLGRQKPDSPRVVGRTIGLIWERTFYGTVEAGAHD